MSPSLFAETMRERDRQPAMATASRKLLGRSLIAASLGQQDPRAGTERRQIRALEAGAHGDVTRAAETGVWIGIGGMRRRPTMRPRRRPRA